MNCPNCLQEHGPIDVCVLGAVGIVVRDRGFSNRQVTAAIEAVDADLFWEKFGGPAADWLEEHIPEELK